MPRPRCTVSHTCEAAGDGSLPLGRPLGFGEGLCTCAKCMRKAGPVREDAEERKTQISYILADVFEDTPNPSSLVTDKHRAKAQEFLQALEEQNCVKLTQLFDKAAKENMWREIATELIISAAQLGFADVIRLLSARGADLEVRDNNRGGRPLMHAANNGHTSAVKALLECGAKPDNKDNHGYTALIVAVFSDRCSTAEVLIKGGAQLDVVDNRHRTALSYAAMYGSVDCINLLASLGADVFHADNEGKSPLMIAEESNRPQAAEALKKLQMRVQMRERRNKQKLKNEGNAQKQDTDMAQLEADAMAKAIELLKEIEEEQARKNAKNRKVGAPAQPAASSNKKKVTPKAKGDPAAVATQVHMMCEDANGWSTNAPASSAPVSQAPASTHNRIPTAPIVQQQQTVPPPVAAAASAPPGGGSSGGASAGPIGATFWLEEVLQRARPVQPQPQASAPAAAVPASAAPAVIPTATSSGSPAQLCAATSPKQQGPNYASMDVEALRKAWEEALEQASKCMDEVKQPAVLAHVQALLPLCSSKGISVKYGRKVMQRLESVAPARQALQAAVAMDPPSCAALDAALKTAKNCRSLLDAALLQKADDLFAKAQKLEEQARWNSMASNMHAAATVQQQAAVAAVAAAAAQHHDDHLDDDLECVVCWAATKTMMCLPCSHVCMCPTCAESVQAKGNMCPVCRSEIECVIELLG